MAPPAIEASVINFSPFGGSGFPLAPAGGSIVVEGLDLDWRVDCWSNGDVYLLQMGTHTR